MYHSLIENKNYVEKLEKEIHSSLVENDYHNHTRNDNVNMTKTNIPSLNKNYRSHADKMREIYKYMYGRNIVRP